jgi:hypothetical protein
MDMVGMGGASECRRQTRLAGKNQGHRLQRTKSVCSIQRQMGRFINAGAYWIGAPCCCRSRATEKQAGASHQSEFLVHVLYLRQGRTKRSVERKRRGDAWAIARRRKARGIIQAKGPGPMTPQTGSCLNAREAWRLILCGLRASRWTQMYRWEAPNAHPAHGTHTKFWE